MTTPAGSPTGAVSMGGVKTTEESPRRVQTEQAGPEKPELLVLGAFAGGLVFAQLLKVFGGDS